MPVRSIHPFTLPVAGSMRAIESFCHTFAQISPFTHSSSFSWLTMLPLSFTSSAFVAANVFGSR